MCVFSRGCLGEGDVIVQPLLCVYSLNQCVVDRTRAYMCDVTHSHIYDMPHLCMHDKAHSHICDMTHSRKRQTTHSHICNMTCSFKRATWAFIHTWHASIMLFATWHIHACIIGSIYIHVTWRFRTCNTRTKYTRGGALHLKLRLPQIVGVVWFPLNNAEQESWVIGTKILWQSWLFNSRSHPSLVYYTHKFLYAICDMKHSHLHRCDIEVSSVRYIVYAIFIRVCHTYDMQHSHLHTFYMKHTYIRNVPFAVNIHIFAIYVATLWRYD